MGWPKTVGGSQILLQQCTPRLLAASSSGIPTLIKRVAHLGGRQRVRAYARIHRYMPPKGHIPMDTRICARALYARTHNTCACACARVTRARCITRARVTRARVTRTRYARVPTSTRARAYACARTRTHPRAHYTRARITRARAHACARPRGDMFTRTQDK